MAENLEYLIKSIADKRKLGYTLAAARSELIEGGVPTKVVSEVVKAYEERVAQIVELDPDRSRT